ncbi:hypothetical protein VSU19_20205 [Verrucomicrobiales bacterium BCK34]|nr:hypothetical protein [Verrucomicrobiales bacterium BCK34]
MTAPPPETHRIRRVERLLDTLDDLLSENAEEAQRVSIYVPAGRTHDDVPESRLQLKGAFKEVGKLLDGNGGEEILDILEDEIGPYLDKESEESEFWQHQAGGLAIFADAETVRVIQVPESFSPQCSYSTKWFLTPLLELAANIDSYWLLSLSQNEVALYRGSRLGIREVVIPGGNPSFKESETAAARSSGDDPDIIDAEANKENLQRFFEEVNEPVRKILGDSNDPLLIAGVDFYLPLYAEANTYPNLVEKIVSGNAEHESLDDLHESATDLLYRDFAESRKRELLRLKELAASGAFVTNLQEILAAASMGRVDSLVAPSDLRCRGKITDPATGSFEKLSPGDPKGFDLYQTAAELTLSRGGRLFYLEATKMPGGNEICAELRY